MRPAPSPAALDFAADGLAGDFDLAISGASRLARTHVLAGFSVQGPFARQDQPLTRD
jgi:hypothetical protein